MHGKKPSQTAQGTAASDVSEIAGRTLHDTEVLSAVLKKSIGLWMVIVDQIYKMLS